MFRTRVPLPILILLFTLILVAAAPFSSAQSTLTWEPASPVNGSPLIFVFSPPKELQSLSGTWLQHSLFFDFDPSSKSWTAIGGVSFETPPGIYNVILKGKLKNGKEVEFEQKIPVQAANYRRIEISVPKQYTEPSAEQLRVIAADKELKQAVLGRVSPARQWSGAFDYPVSAITSDGFGTQRFINGKVQSVHQGLDFAVPAGTPVAAINDGTVLLARFLYFEGNCVVLDHGEGLLTLYFHLSELDVIAGQRVRRGQKIALSGGTGRATGPHLHLAIRWQGTYLDPATLLQLKMN